MRQRGSALLQQYAVSEFSAALGVAGPEPAAVAAAYRSWARDHRELYELVARRPLQPALLGARGPVAAAPLIAVAGGDADIALQLFGFLHGLVDLEMNGHVSDADLLNRAWRDGVAALVGKSRADEPPESSGPRRDRRTQADSFPTGPVRAG